MIQQYVEEYLKLLETIQTENLQATISVKPSQIGLAAEIPLYGENLLKIIAAAEGEGRFVWIDMENSPYTKSTVEIYRELVGTHKDLGLRSEEHTSELQSHHDLVCRLLL